MKYGVQIKFPVTNNEEEYETILTGLRIAQALKAKNALLRSDSQLVIRQVKGDLEAKETRMQRYLKLTNQLVSKFDRVEFAQVPRDQIVEADEMAKSVSIDNQADLDGNRLPRPWNIEHLKRYYE